LIELRPAVEDPTFTVVSAEATVPAAFVASAVYVVVSLGVTVMDPPVDESVYELPSEPVTVTLVAFPAVTVSVSDSPGVIELFLAVIDTVGAVFPEFTVTVVWAVALPLELVAVAV
jgi:hypothetical protein